jgi:hypothetical protein
MSKRYRLHCAAVGGVVVALLAGDGYGQSRTPAPATQPQQQQPRAAPPPPANNRQVEAKVYQPECNRPADKDEAEFCEQRRSADAAQQQVIWAREQAIWTERQSYIGAFGLLGVVVSLILSAWAAIAASRAAIAADKAVAVAADTARRQLRAYINVESVTLDQFEIGKPVTVVVSAPNNGQTPATKVKMLVSLRFVSVPLANSLAHDPVEMGSEATIGPKVYVNVAAMVRDGENGPPTILGQQHVTALKEGSLALVCFGTITYEDVFGDTVRQTNLRYQTLTNECREDRFALVASSEGNEAT